MSVVYSKAALVGALVLAGASILWNLGLAYWLLVPGGSGEWTRLAALFAWVVGFPLALAALVAAFLAQEGPPRLTRTARITCVLALAMPLLVTLLSRTRI